MPVTSKRTLKNIHSPTNESYLALTAHFVSDSFTLESVLLDCSQIEGSHTADHLADTIKHITDEYNISDKIILVVSDNAPNIVAAVNKLKWRHFGCYAHTINLVVQNALLIVHDIRERAKNIVSFYKRSNLATEKLLKYQKDTGVGQPKKVIQDVVTRWNSTYYMCQRLVLLQDAVKTSLALCEKPELNLTAEEWKILSELVHVLAPFEAITRQISGEGYVTGSLVIVITAGLLNVCSELLKKPFHKTVLQTVSDLKHGIEKRLQNIEFSKTAGICTFLDPRFKLHGFTVDMAKCNINKEITELVTKEINLNKRKMAHEGDNPQAKKSRTVEEINELSVWGYIDNIMENQPETNSTSSAVIEVQRYLDERAIGRKEDPLKWWAENHHHYPNLSKLFKSKFAMVATSVPCERVFSKTGLLLSERRTRLKSKKVKEIIFLSANSK